MGAGEGTRDDSPAVHIDNATEIALRLLDTLNGMTFEVPNATKTGDVTVTDAIAAQVCPMSDAVCLMLSFDASWMLRMLHGVGLEWLCHVYGWCVCTTCGRSAMQANGVMVGCSLSAPTVLPH